MKKKNVAVYDIEVPENHNFILNNGVIAHNCSHSVSYAYIAYIEAWWKLHYPEYYWLGKLTAFQDKTDKMLAFMDEARSLILQPCIIRSHSHEWQTENGKIRAPLSTLKGVGADAALNAQEIVKKSLDGDWQKELDECGHLHHRWGQTLLGFSAAKEDKKRGFNASTLLNMLYNGTFDIFFETSSDYISLPIQAEQVKKSLGSKATGGNTKKGQTVSISGIEDDIMLNIWRSENNAVHVYLLSQLEKIKETLIESGFEQVENESSEFLYTRKIVWADQYKERMVFPRVDVLYNWTELSKDEDLVRKYLPEYKGVKNTRVCAFVGLISNMQTKISKNNNEYINLTINTGTETIANVNLFGKMMDKYASKIKNKMICMIMFQPNKWNGLYTPEILGIVPFFEIK